MFVSQIYSAENVVEDFHGTDLSHINFNAKYNTQCPKCAEEGGDTSHDNLHVYGLDDGGEPLGCKCWACNFKVPSLAHERDKSEDPKGGKGKVTSTLTNNTLRSKVKKKPADLDSKRLSKERIEEIHSKTTPHLTVKYRGLHRFNKILEKIGVRWSLAKDVSGELQVEKMYFPVFYNNGDNRELVGYRVRVAMKNGVPHKDFYVEGYCGIEGAELIGKSYNSKIGETLIIVGGEVDLISTLGAMDDLMTRYKSRKINVISTINGEKSLAETIRSDYDWIVAHNQIILAMDNDLAGQAATDEALKVLPSEQVFLANFGEYNDPNSFGYDIEALKTSIYWSVQPVDDFGYVGADELFDEGLRVLMQDKIPLPDFLSDLKPFFTDGAIGLGEWVNIIAGTSTGKSTIIDAWKDAWIELSPYKQVVNSFEASSGRYGIKEVSAMAGRNISKIAGKENRIEYYQALREEYMNRVLGGDGRPKYFFVSKIPKSVEMFKKMLLRLVKVEGVGVIWIDPALSLKALCPTYKEFDDLLTWIDQTIRLEHNTTIVTVQHTRKNLASGKNASQGGELTEEDGEGTRMLISLATINIGIERNKESEDPIERNTTLLSLFKNRPDGETGRHVAKLFYRYKANRLYPYSVALANNFFADDAGKAVLELDQDNGYSLDHITTDPDTTEKEHKSDFVEDGKGAFPDPSDDETQAALSW